ncbi:unnamed protein product [Peronospora belbahrii]|uniref:Protein kinase domain-containing protein n=1 Tax=Peronospora belbahrii TaxID=622444 RepID=A0AAU9L968_9STRA|nr:unnamed protein product [Peronospora belbahrii]
MQGYPQPVAPKILMAQPYGKQVDIFSCGVITYILLCGYPPFHHDNQNAFFRLIKAGRYGFDSPYWDDISAEAKNLIRKMLIWHQRSDGQHGSFYTINGLQRMSLKTCSLLRHYKSCGSSTRVCG